LLQNVTDGLGTGRILWINYLSKRMVMRFATWNVKSLYRAGSLMALAKAIST
jgi:hypothetical protein